MTDRWNEIDAEFGRLLLMSTGERVRALDELSAADAEMGAEVASLLTASTKAETFLESPAIEHCRPMLEDDLELRPYAADARGQLVGRYRLVSPIGRGGMGDVWLAERADGAFDQRVALKLVKRGMDSEEVLMRFRRERQILARLEHPNIARLLDGGLHADGRPFLVMEYVDGESCTALCRDTALPLESKLNVFGAICRAVHYAHQNLVVHGDIKPSNIVVAADGTVKLLDFGIARLLAGDHSFETRTGWSRAVTPEYASPEQLRGESLTTSSDIYQLGALLFELLSGRRLHQSARTRFDGTSKATLAAERVVPSAVLRKEDGGPGAERRWRAVRGDLDAIVLQALESESTRRYASAANMADDITRHRSGNPVHARGANRRYHLTRFLRKHRAQLATSAAVLVMGLALITGNTVRLKRERDRALLQATKAGQSAEVLVQFFDGWNLDAADRSQVNAAELLRRVTLSTEREFAEDNEVRAAMLSLLGQLNASTGEFREARLLLDTAVQLQRGQPDVDPAELGASLRRRGHLFATLGNYADAERDLREAKALLAKSLGASHLETLRTQRELAQILGVTERNTEAVQEVKDILSKLASSNRAAIQFRSEVQSDLGYDYFRQGRYTEALSVLDPLLTEQRALFGDVHIATLTTMRALASTARDMGALERAESLYREALRASTILYGSDQQPTLTATLVLALHLHRTWRLQEARALTEQALARLRMVPVDARGGMRFAEMSLTGLAGVIRLDQSDFDESARYLRAALARMHQLFPQGTEEETDWVNRLAYIDQRTGSSSASATFAEAIAVRKRRKPSAIDYATDGLHFLAWAMNARGDHAGAESLYRRTDTLYKRTLIPTHPYRLFVERQLSLGFTDSSRHATAGTGPAATASRTLPGRP